MTEIKIIDPEAVLWHEFITNMKTLKDWAEFVEEIRVDGSTYTIKFKK